MKLNLFETLLMNNPVRAAIQRYYETPRLLRLAPAPIEAPRTLVIGCGRGVDIEMAFESFGSRSVAAVDLDPEQVRRAQKRLGNKYNKRLELIVADAADIPFEDETFDLILDFGIIHHIPEWRRCIAEIRRLLAPGGRFIFEEVPKKKLDTHRYRIFTEHPREDRFSADDFKAACEGEALRVDAGPYEFFGFFRGAAIKQ